MKPFDEFRENVFNAICNLRRIFLFIKSNNKYCLLIVLKCETDCGCCGHRSVIMTSCLNDN